MNKRIIVNASLSLCLITALAGCSKFLEKAPDNRTQLDSPEKVSQLLGTAYPQANYMAFCESISDNVNDKGAGSLMNTNLNPYFFQDVQDNQQDSPEFYWDACYAAIAAANQALDACNKATDSLSYRGQKGEALVARAYAHFMLVTLFSKVYNPATANADPGIPYVTTPENIVFKNYERKTVQYVYDMIESDLTAGLPLINDNLYTVPKYHFTKAAAHAFAARFYLFKKNYAKVIEHANEVFPEGFLPNLRPWNTVYKTLTYNELFARYEKATENANILLVETSSLWARSFYSTRYGMDATVKNYVLSRAPVTGGKWAMNNQLYTAGTGNYMIPKINEYFVRLSVNATIGMPYVMVPLFTAEEVLFNKAEANIYLNNVPDVITDLNTYASTRIVNYDPTINAITQAKALAYYGGTDIRNALLNNIIDFKQVEYVQEGMRWFDLLRYNIPVTHKTTTGGSFTLTSTDLRRVFQIPQSAGLSNVDLNPR